LGEEERGRMKRSTGLLWIIGLLVLVTLACAQSGEILSSEDATAAAREESNLARPISGGDIVIEGPQIGSEATLDGKGVIVNLLNEPGGSISGGAARGATITILDIAEHEGEHWFLINGSSGDGWVRRENIEAIEAEAGSDTGVEGPQPGDVVYLTSVSYLINLLREPGGFIIAGQERGTEVTILDVTNYEGELWYLVDAPTGDGWIPAENIATEPTE
jgi:hypothetical protein